MKYVVSRIFWIISKKTISIFCGLKLTDEEDMHNALHRMYPNIYFYYGGGNRYLGTYGVATPTNVSHEL